MSYNYEFFKEVLNTGPFWLISSVFVVVRQFLLNPDKKDIKTILGTVILGIPLASFTGNAFFEYTSMLQVSFLITAVTALLAEAIIAYFINNDNAIIQRIVERISNRRNTND